MEETGLKSQPGCLLGSNPVQKLNAGPRIHVWTRHLVIHLAFAAASPMLSFWYYVMYIQYAETFSAFARTTLTAKVTGGKQELDY